MRSKSEARSEDIDKIGKGSIEDFLREITKTFEKFKEKHKSLMESKKKTQSVITVEISKNFEETDTISKLKEEIVYYKKKTEDLKAELQMLNQKLSLQKGNVQD